MSKRRAFWLLLATGIMLPFNCIPTVPDLATLIQQIQNLLGGNN